MPRYPNAAESIVDQLRLVGWWSRAMRFDWLAASCPLLANRVAALMAPDELLYGTLTGSTATGHVIALPDIVRPIDLVRPMRQLTIEEAFERSVRARR